MNLYMNCLENLNRTWLHNQIVDIFTNEGKNVGDKDLALVCRWLRGFHAATYSNNGDYWYGWTQPGRSYNSYSRIFIRNYIASNWVFVVDYLPTLPSSPSGSFSSIDDKKIVYDYRQGTLL